MRPNLYISRSQNPMTSPLRNILNKFRLHARSKPEMGRYFERLACYYIEHDPIMSEQYESPQRYAEWARSRGKDARDTGIDIVAKVRGEDGWCAIQCKFFKGKVYKKDIDSFFTASGKKEFSRRLIIDTSEEEWSDNALAALDGQDKPVTRVSLADLEHDIAWECTPQAGLKAQPIMAKKKIRRDQREAVKAVCKGLENDDRGKLIMPCGTGKSFISLLIAEKMVGEGKSVLFLVPSLSLMSQIIRVWAQDKNMKQRCFSACSDAEVGKRRKYRDDVAEIQAHDLVYPATTEADTLAEKVGKNLPPDCMTVIFATYHSIQVISDAQKNHGLGEFSLIICDEAHRTTGVKLAGQNESNFVKIHEQGHVQGKKRLYMTATPRVFGEAARSKASDESIELCSMDDEKMFGKNLFARGFGWAVENKLLSDYKVIVLGIDEAIVSAGVQNRLADEGNELDLDNATKYIGCYRALAKRGLEEVSSLPMQRALAFCKDIKHSKLMEQEFAKVITSYLESKEGLSTERGHRRLDCKVQHVDGTDNAKIRSQRINWLQEQDKEEACHILSNARCLAEGVDVPALDAILFMHPRKSQIDVVQAVGRVMRRAPNKEKGYVILPIGIPAGIEPREALNDNKRYHMVWNTLNALRSHDERLESDINKAWLEKNFNNLSSHIEIIAVSDRLPSNAPGDEKKNAGTEIKKNEKPSPDWQPVLFDDWSNAVMAKIVDKNRTPDYWKKWAKNIADIAQAHVSRIHGLIKNPGKEREAFESFLTEIRNGLNNNITEKDTVEMLAQHLVTQPVFKALFGDHNFVQQNPVSRAMEKILEILHNHNIEKERMALQEFYESIQLRAKGVKDPKARQEIIVELYEGFFRNAFPDMTSRLGIAYTPVELVDFILNSVNAILDTEFDLTLGSKGVHIVDPFTGTGTFITRLLQSDLIKPSELKHKYLEEMHANEIMPLAYYIAAINIETAYQNAAAATGINNNEYVPFQGICLTDTFQLDEQESNGLISDFLAANSSRRSRQQQLRDIRVIVGNPPYSVSQRDINKDTSPVKYPRLDQRIKETYGDNTPHNTTTTTLYDNYIRAIRWASDRIGDDGVIGYVTNAGWLEGKAGGGVRKSVVEEFSSIYVFHLRGNARTSGLKWRKEGGKVFGSGSRASISIVLLVKNNKNTKNGKIYFHDIGDYLSREEKLRKISEMHSIAGHNGNLPEWDLIIPDRHGDWLGQRAAFPEPYIRIGGKVREEYLFNTRSGGIEAKRDAWVYNDSKERLMHNLHIMIDTYNRSVSQVGQGDVNNPKKISWSYGLRRLRKSGKEVSFNRDAMQIVAYRPFNLRHHYNDKDLNENRAQMPRIFPCESVANRAICISGPIAGATFSALMTKHAIDSEFMRWTQCFPLYYRPANAGSVNDHLLDTEEQKIAITDEGMGLFHSAYPEKVVCKEEIFYYTYGFLHSPSYRKRFVNTLDKEFPGIWPVKKYEDFLAFVQAGRDLGDLHCDFNKVEQFEVIFNTGGTALVAPQDPKSFYRVRKMKFAGTGTKLDKSTVIYNSNITISGIPLEAYNYVVNGRSALEWVMRRQQVSVDKDSGIVNDPNDFANEVMGDPAYPLKLFQRIITVSLETLKIVENLPPLDLGDKKK